MKKIHILGSGSLITPYLISTLSKEGYYGTVLGRTQYHPTSKNFTWGYLDVDKKNIWNAENNAYIISLLPIWMLKNLLPHLKSCKQIIALSSSSIETKNQQDEEKKLVNKLIEGEEFLKRFSNQYSIPYTIFRPTMIYDGVNDKNIAVIAKFIKRFRFFPILKPAMGLRQPLHVEDLVNIMLKSINNEQVCNKTFSIVGGEKLTYQEMLNKIFRHYGIKPRLISMPKSWLSLLLKCLNQFKKTDYTISMFARMSQDMIFDSTELEKIVDYKPRFFQLK